MMNKQLSPFLTPREFISVINLNCFVKAYFHNNFINSPYQIFHQKFCHIYIHKHLCKKNLNVDRFKPSTSTALTMHIWR